MECVIILANFLVNISTTALRGYKPFSNALLTFKSFKKIVLKRTSKTKSLIYTFFYTFVQLLLRLLCISINTSWQSRPLLHNCGYNCLLSKRTMWKLSEKLEMAVVQSLLTAALFHKSLNNLFTRNYLKLSANIWLKIVLAHSSRYLISHMINTREIGIVGTLCAFLLKAHWSISKAHYLKSTINSYKNEAVFTP